jgi:SAM-dependent methyltransferase
MDFREFEVMYKAEGRHWWYRGLREMLFRRAGLRDPASREWTILDAGCGTGGNLQALRRSGHIYAQGFDYAEAAVQFCRQRGLHNVRQASITDIPFPGDEFDLVYSCDVLCDTGTSSQEQALAELYRVTRPGGRLFLNLPAYAFLRSEHDAATDVDRRYTMRQVRAMVETAGFTVERLSHWNATLFPVVAAVRLARKRGKSRDRTEARSDIQVPAPPINRLLTAIVRTESRLTDWISLPYGSSVLCLARKPAHPTKGTDPTP